MSGVCVCVVFSARRKFEVIIFPLVPLFTFPESFHRVLKLLCKVFVLKQISGGDILCLVRVGYVA